MRCIILQVLRYLIWAVHISDAQGQLLTETRLTEEAVFIGTITSRDIQQTLFPDINFQCTGFLHKWTIVASSVGGGSRYPELQLWRRLMDTNDFSRVATTVLSSQTPRIASNIYEQIVDPPIQFEAGDVLGVYTPPVPKLSFKFQKQGGPRNYYIGGPATARSSFSLDGGLVLSARNDYPLISVTATPMECSTGFIEQHTLLLKASLLTVNNSDLIYREAAQRIIPEAVFTTSGMIVDISVGALLRSGRSSYPEIQIWRATNEEQNEWTRVQSIGSSAAITTQDLNIHKYTPFPTVDVLAGDIIGLYQPYTHNSALNIYMQSSGPLNYYRPALGQPLDSFTVNSVLTLSERRLPLIVVHLSVSEVVTTSTMLQQSHSYTKHSSTSTAVISLPSVTPARTTHWIVPSVMPTMSRPNSVSIVATVLAICLPVLGVSIVGILILIRCHRSIIQRSTAELTPHGCNNPTRDSATSDASLQYNSLYTPQNPSEIISKAGNRELLDLKRNTAYDPNHIHNPIDTEHIYESV